MLKTTTLAVAASLATSSYALELPDLLAQLEPNEVARVPTLKGDTVDYFFREHYDAVDLTGVRQVIRATYAPYGSEIGEEFDCTE